MIASVLLVLALAADDPKPAAAAVPAEMRHIAGLASATAPEIQAAALLRLAEMSRLSTDQRQELVEQAFTLASQAREPYPRLAIYGAPPDTADAYRNAASSLRLDRLSLQVRAINQSFGLQRPKLSRGLLERLERPTPGHLACETGAIPDLREYFETVRDLDTQLASAESPLEISILASSVSTEAQAAAFAGKLATLAPDSRAFAATWDALQPALTRLYGRFPSQELTDAIRAYLLNNLNGPRCVDASHVFQSSRDIAIWYNTLPGSRPIREEDLKPIKAQGRIQSENYWDGEASKALMDDLRLLRLSGTTGLPFTPDERKSTEWKQSLDAFLVKLRSANPGFHQTSALLQALVEFTPHGPERDRILASYIEVMRASDLQQKSPAEWLWRADSLFRMLDQDSDRPKLLTAFRNSNLPPLVLYAWFVENMGSAGMF